MALLDLIPVIGSTIGGAIVTLTALTVSLPVALGTLGFYVAYRLAEDYLIVPRVIGRTVQIPAAVTVIVLLIGGALLGIVGALIAIPAAAAISLLLREISFPAWTAASSHKLETRPGWATVPFRNALRHRKASPMAPASGARPVTSQAT